ncbi:MAG: NAD-dependent protein deacylase [Candidatus Limnocylindria bacterium]
MSHPTPSPEFAISPALEEEIARAAALVAGASNVVALTGAGLSVESGIPPFRGPGGLWTKYGEPPLDGYQRFLRDPKRAWRDRLSPREPWAQALAETLGSAKPNAGHRALAELEAIGRCGAVITQNIDDLHRQAGARALIEIHGNHKLLRCLGCVARFAAGEIEIDPERLPPLCPRCGGVVKGDTVHFGEPIPADVLRRCHQVVERADCMLVVGTSATVYPAAEFPLDVLRRGGSLIEVNPEPSELSDLATLSLRGPGGAVLSRLVEIVARARDGSPR